MNYFIQYQQTFSNIISDLYSKHCTNVLIISIFTWHFKSYLSPKNNDLIFKKMTSIGSDLKVFDEDISNDFHN